MGSTRDLGARHNVGCSSSFLLPPSSQSLATIFVVLKVLFFLCVIFCLDSWRNGCICSPCDCVIWRRVCDCVENAFCMVLHSLRFSWFKIRMYFLVSSIFSLLWLCLGNSYHGISLTKLVLLGFSSQCLCICGLFFLLCFVICALSSHHGTSSTKLCFRMLDEDSIMLSFDSSGTWLSCYNTGFFLFIYILVISVMIP